MARVRLGKSRKSRPVRGRGVTFPGYMSRTQPGSYSLEKERDIRARCVKSDAYSALYTFVVASFIAKNRSHFLARCSKSGPAIPAARGDNLCATKRRRAGIKGRIAVYPARFSPAGGRGRQMPLADANRYGSRGGDGTAHLHGGGDMGPLDEGCIRDGGL